MKEFILGLLLILLLYFIKGNVLAAIEFVFLNTNDLHNFLL